MYRMKVKLTLFYTPTQQVIKISKVWVDVDEPTCVASFDEYLVKLHNAGFQILKYKKEEI